jgi:hypothetical protein
MVLLGAGTAVARPSQVWSGQAETAALRVGTAAQKLAETGRTIGMDGRIARLTVLRSDAEDLVRRADALARMTVEPLPEDTVPKDPAPSTQRRGARGSGR